MAETGRQATSLIRAVVPHIACFLGAPIYAASAKSALISGTLHQGGVPFRFFSIARTLLYKCADRDDGCARGECVTGILKEGLEE